jgi:ribosomal protein S17E
MDDESESASSKLIINKVEAYITDYIFNISKYITK